MYVCVCRRVVARLQSSISTDLYFFSGAGYEDRCDYASYHCFIQPSLWLVIPFITPPVRVGQ